MKKAACLAFLAVLSGIFPSHAAPLWLWRMDEKTDPARLEMAIRLNAPTTVTSVDATAEGQKLPVQFVPFGEGENDKSAVLFLIDTSDPKRSRSIEAAKALVLRLIDMGDARTQFAIYTFDSNLVPVAEFGTPRDEMAGLLKPVKTRGMATELYRNSIEAIRVLQSAAPWRRSLVLLSDGKAEDTVFTLDNVLEAAKTADVTIDGVGYAEAPQDTIHLQSLRRLADGSNGAFAEGDQRTKNVPESYLNDFFPRLHSGGFVVVNLADNKTANAVELDFHTPLWPSVKIPYTLTTLAPPPPKPVPGPDARKVDEMATTVADMAKKMEAVAKEVAAVPAKVEDATKKAEEARLAEEKKAAEEEFKRTETAKAKAAAIEERRATAEAQQGRKRRLIWGAVLLVLLVAAAGLLLSRRQQQQQAAAVAESLPVFARLQVLDGDATEHLMRTTALRVGRGKDNDLTLKNDSVSRHHAEISRTREGAFTIIELNAGNGVLVNGKQVEKATLNNEDIIELGEVRIRFLIA
jgi:hypothetical protein